MRINQWLTFSQKVFEVIFSFKSCIRASPRLGNDRSKVKHGELVNSNNESR